MVRIRQTRDDLSVDIQRAVTPSQQAAARLIRRQVFQIEQGIPYALDVDGRDAQAWHWLGWVGCQPAATARLHFVQGRLGVIDRVAVVQQWRSQGLGHCLLKEIELAAIGCGLQHLKLHPHRHLESFYRRLGYSRVGESAVGRYPLVVMKKRLQ